ncbi:hypothetical protein [Bradyrhizobium sp. BR 10289]|uniref:hypothetical protein n=1 Tax=Bradyrhizobium sp. BR 10289 TaxID=2749993 RepID=UPI001C64B6B5|nr:hypothetical protein [Bradyrhizobium sp. BR 10289]MBW7974387.1 hypothetical protein [Bradyrhizobium sp. BR 10289]
MLENGELCRLIEVNSAVGFVPQILQPKPGCTAFQIARDAPRCRTTSIAFGGRGDQAADAATTPAARRFLADQLVSSGKIIQGLGVEPE